MNWKEFIFALLISILTPAAIWASFIHKIQNTSFRNGGGELIIAVIAFFFLNPIILLFIYSFKKDYKNEEADNSFAKGFLYGGWFWVIISLIFIFILKDSFRSNY